MPFVRNVVAQWQPRNCEPMVDFLDSWAHIIPVWILDNILDQLIFPKLQKEVWRSAGLGLPCTRAPRLKDPHQGWWPAVSVLAFSIVESGSSFLPRVGVAFLRACIETA